MGREKGRRLSQSENACDCEQVGALGRERISWDAGTRIPGKETGTAGSTLLIGG